MILFLLILLPLAIIGMPLFAVIGGLAAGLFHADGQEISNLMIESYRLAGQSVLVSIPLFTFAGFILAESGSPRRLVRVSQALLGFVPGGLAIVALVACAFFTAFTGASGVTIIGVGGLLLPALLRQKYTERFSLGLLTTAGSLGLLFAPSLPIIIYGYISGVNIDHLFRAGVLPGIFLIFVLSLYSMVQAKRSGVPLIPLEASEVKAALWEAKWELPLPVLVIAGIYGGWFTATEASAITVVYVFVIEFLLYRDLSIRKDMVRIMRETMVFVGGFKIIIAVALGLTSYLVFAEVPDMLFRWLQTFVHSKIAFLLVLNVFLLVVGAFMDIFSAIIVVVPLIAPIATGYGINPVHLAIIFLTNLEIGFSMPPLGINLFIGSFRFKKPVANLYRASLPFLVLYIFALLIITYWPELSLYLVPQGKPLGFP